MKLRLLAFALLLTGGVSAQNPYIALQGVNETASGVAIAQPRTILAVDVTVERDLTFTGPYARYAQKYLGVRAPTSMPGLLHPLRRAPSTMPPPTRSSRACNPTRPT